MGRVAQILYRLQLLDSQLSEQLSKLRETESLIGESQELMLARRAYEQATAQSSLCKKRLRDLEMDLQRINARIRSTEERLYGGQVSNPKELAGLQQDYQHSKQARGRLEDETLSAMLQLDDCQEAAAVTSERLANIETTWRQGQESLARQIEQLRTQVGALRGQRAEMAARVQPGDMAQYEELLRKKGGRAVALLVGQMCEGCRVTVPASKSQLVRRSEGLETCTNCGRILSAEK
ncbi:MAG: hypothetical protein FJ026_01965 [Chloroflexi bacterium]|nr:hypothetical protein [Chloroflexota bacterium]